MCPINSEAFFMNTNEVIDYFFPVGGAHELLPNISLHKTPGLADLRSLAEAGIIEKQWSENHTYGRVFTGGAHLARYILENPEEVLGKRVVDIGSGSGVVAIAAAMAGADHVTALDNDDAAVEFIRRNAEINGTSLDILHQSAFDTSYADADIITAADVFVRDIYDFKKLLESLVEQGKAVFTASGLVNSSHLALQHAAPLRPSPEAMRHYTVEPTLFMRLDKSLYL